MYLGISWASIQYSVPRKLLVNDMLGPEQESTLVKVPTKKELEGGRGGEGEGVQAKETAFTQEGNGRGVGFV